MSITHFSSKRIRIPWILVKRTSIVAQRRVVRSSYYDSLERIALTTQFKTLSRCVCLLSLGILLCSWSEDSLRGLSLTSLQASSCDSYESSIFMTHFEASSQYQDLCASCHLWLSYLYERWQPSEWSTATRCLCEPVSKESWFEVLPQGQTVLPLHECAITTWAEIQGKAPSC